MCLSQEERKFRHSSEIRGLCLMKWPSKMLQNLSYFWNTKTTWVFDFLYSKSMANFEAFRKNWNISSSINILFLKSATKRLFFVEFSNCNYRTRHENLGAYLSKSTGTASANLRIDILCTFVQLDIVFWQISTFLEYSVVVVYELRGL